ncbi:IS66 family insertion sequence element accessory protein TnpB, partial [Adlercreutzia sp.]
MNPLTSPDRILISRHPTDMRAGIQRLASIVSTDFGEDPQDGALYC